MSSLRERVEELVSSSSVSKQKFRVGQILKYGADLLCVKKVHHEHIHCIRYMSALTSQLTSVEVSDKHLRPLTKREKGR